MKKTNGWEATKDVERKQRCATDLYRGDTSYYKIITVCITTNPKTRNNKI